jgi:hypothetical protein
MGKKYGSLLNTLRRVHPIKVEEEQLPVNDRTCRTNR